MATSPADGSYDVAVLGAGPAGLSAAVTAAAQGSSVVLVDAAPRPGGQYWRHREGDDSLPQSIREGLSGVVFLPSHAIWHVERTNSDFTIHALRDGTARQIRSRTVVVATGAYDRQLPFPGWTVPGVFTVGAVQALLKGQGVRAGQRIVIAGTGPFLLPVAAGLAKAGVDVVGVFEAGRPTAFARTPLAVLRNASKVVEGADYLRILARHRIPFRTRTAVVAAHGTESVTGVTVAQLDRPWRVVRQRELACDTLAVGYGFTAQTEIPLQLGCEMVRDADGSLVAMVDDQQRSTVPGVYVAGEACGVGGAQLSVVEGQIAGLHAANARPSARLFRRRAALRAFAAAMYRAYPIQPGWQSWLRTDTIACRCEEVTVGTIQQAVDDLGATDPRAVKSYARPGMGLCQGRVCGYSTACLVAARNNRAVNTEDLRGMAGRPIGQPVPLGVLSKLEDS
jgi:NADPH-dependent 2,4-dienoyl-CoA reductase/sulfur reductase-like enzyme